ncbi:MAG TPA: hypothetical protein VJR25_14155 [Microbacterium sp.]|nr:hypothetical protein [Microbacterium sp.]HKT57903.1 hypothetical protein [Microbacterium sp.]
MMPTREECIDLAAAAFADIRERERLERTRESINAPVDAAGSNRDSGVQD